MSYVKSDKWDGKNYSISRQEAVCLPEGDDGSTLQVRGPHAAAQSADTIKYDEATLSYHLITCAHGRLARICVLRSSTSFMAAYGAASVPSPKVFPSLLSFLLFFERCSMLIPQLT